MLHGVGFAVVVPLIINGSFLLRVTQYTATSGGMDPAPLLEHRKVFKASVQTKYDCSAERNAELAQRAKLVRFKSRLLHRVKEKTQVTH